MKIDPNDFRIRSGDKVRLKHLPTCVKPYYESKEHYQETLRKHVEQLDSLQSLLYAGGHWALLVVFQGMDAAGKDSAIKHVMFGVNPQGCHVASFKQPSAEELKHDFLWRTTAQLPERGSIGIFNRSYYEEVLVVQVHPELLEAQHLPEQIVKDKDIWDCRYRSIAQFEKHLSRNGTRIIKFFLHISKDEQRKRFLKRIDEPEKNWKFSVADIQERQYWKDYVKAYEKCVGATSTDEAPWYVIPADDKANARLIISQTIVDTLKSLDLRPPRTDAKRREDLKALRQMLEKPE